MAVDLTVVIPNRNSPYLNKTILDIFSKAVTNIEIVVNIDENWPEQLLDDKRITYIHPASSRGMRFGINAGVALARGKYVMKTDDHCMFGPGFDKILIENHLENNWVQIPRRYSLDADKWEINRTRPFRDYMYLTFPSQGGVQHGGIRGTEWWERQKTRTDPSFDIDDTPSMQGSCYFMTKDHFDNFLEGMSEVGYGTFAQEAQEIGNKTWLGGGALKVNKKTWYAHLHKGKQHGRMYHVGNAWYKEMIDGTNWSADFWMNNKWEKRIHDFSWLVDEKFPDMPTWPKNWKELYYKK